MRGTERNWRTCCRVWGPSQGHRRRRRRSRARGAGRVLAKDLPSLPVPARALLYPGPRRPAHMATPTASLLSCPSSSKPAPAEVDAETVHAARLPPDPLGPQADSPGRRALGLESLQTCLRPNPNSPSFQPSLASAQQKTPTHRDAPVRISAPLPPHMFRRHAPSPPPSSAPPFVRDPADRGT